MKDKEQIARLPDTDACCRHSDDASVEQLLSMLSPEERARFQAAVEDQDPSQARAHSLLERVSKTQDDYADTKPWWDQARGSRLARGSFIQEAENQSRQASKAETAKIDFNILAVLLAYAYTVRHVGVHSLQDVQDRASDNDEDDMPPLELADGGADKKDVFVEEREALQRIVRENIMQYAPCLAVSGENSRLVLENAEQVSLSFTAAQMSQDVVSEVRPIASK